MPRASKRGRPDGVTLDAVLLKQRRTQLGLSQSGVADLARLGVRTVRTAEKGEPVSADTAKLLASSLGLTYIELLRPPAELVEGRLREHGFALVDPPDGYVEIDEVRVLRTALVDDAVRALCLEGPPGVGKSSLVQYTVAALREQFPDGVVWIAAGRLDTRERLDLVRIELAECLGFRHRMPDPNVVSAAAFDRAFQEHFWRWPRLLVLDDLADMDTWEAFVGDEQHKVVVTTHTRWVAEEVPGTRLILEPWPSERTERLLEDAVGRERLDADPTGRDELLDLIGGLPLHAQLAATGLQRTRHQTPGDYAAGIRRALHQPDTPRSRRDPLVRGLLGGLGRALPEGAVDAVRDLALMGDAPFTTDLAIAAVGRPGSEARRLLDALFDAYVLREVDDTSIGPRMRIESWAVGAWGSPSDHAASRLLSAAPAWLERLGDPGRADLISLNQQQHLGAIRAVLGAVVQRVGVGDAPPRKPADLPLIDPATFDSLPLLPQVVLHLTSLVRLAPPQEAGVWVACAAAVALRNDAQLAYAKLCWLLAWWWYLVGDDLDAACAFSGESARAVKGLGAPDLAVSISLHAGMLRRARGGMAAAEPRYAESLDLARSQPCMPELVSSALLSRASSLLFNPEAPPDWSAALELIEQALALCSERSTARLDMLWCGAAVDRAVVRAALGLQADPAEVDDALCRIIDRLGGDGLMTASSAALVARLGGTFSRPVPDARSIFLHTESEHAEATLQHLVEMTTQLGARCTGRIDDSRRDTRIGHLSAWVVAGFPLGGLPGPAFDLFLPIEPIEDLLIGGGAEHAKRLVAAVRSEGHIAARAIDEVVALAQNSAS